ERNRPWASHRLREPRLSSLRDARFARLSAADYRNIVSSAKPWKVAPPIIVVSTSGQPLSPEPMIFTVAPVGTQAMMGHVTGHDRSPSAATPLLTVAYLGM